MPWRNGGGVTSEVTRHPADGEFDWRISIAEVAVSGVFSPFPGIDRIIMLLDGSRMGLTVGGAAHELVPRRPFAFDGGAETTCDITSPTRDLNVMTRRGVVDAELEVARVDAPMGVRAEARQVSMVLALAGSVRVSDGNGAQWSLEPLDSARCDGPGAATLDGDGYVALVRLREARVVRS